MKYFLDDSLINHLKYKRFFNYVLQMNRDQGWHNDKSHLIPYNDRGGFRGNRGRGDRGGFRGGRGRGRGDGRGRGRGRGRGQNHQYGRYEAFHYRSKGPKQQAPVEHYFKNTMLEDPWAECTPVPVSEVSKKVQVSTRHRYRLFTRLDQTEDNDGLEEPVDKKIKIEREDGEEPEGDVENPDEIEIGSSDEDEDKKPKKKEEGVPEDEEEGEEEDNWEAYDPKHDPNLEDFDPGEIQERRYGNKSDTY